VTRRRPTTPGVPVFAAAVLVTVLVFVAQGVAWADAEKGSVLNHAVVLRGNGIGKAVFGQPEAIAVAGLRAALGAPKSHRPVNLTGNCTVDAGVEWSSMTAYFFHGNFVGYASVSLLAEPVSRSLPHLVTVAGLHIGDTLARATHLYGRSLRTSLAQGGNWSAATSSGTLAGYLTSEVNSTKPPPRIADITAGSVGCPAASP
jgi:hypothetical protein